MSLILINKGRQSDNQYSNKIIEKYLLVQLEELSKLKPELAGDITRYNIHTIIANANNNDFDFNVFTKEQKEFLCQSLKLGKFI